MNLRRIQVDRRIHLKRQPHKVPLVGVLVVCSTGRPVQVEPVPEVRHVVAIVVIVVLSCHPAGQQQSERQATYPGTADVVQHTWDRRGRLAPIFRGSAALASYEYDLINRLTAGMVGDPGDPLVTSAYDWDANSRLVGLVHTNNWPTDILNREYRYDYEGNRRSFRDVNGGELSEVYEYDGLSRLRTMLRGGMNANHQLTGGPPAPLTGAAEWVEMDLRGNWTTYREYVDNTEQLDWTYGETRSHNGANAMLTRLRDFDGPNGEGGGSGSPESFATEYDLRGNLTSDQVHGYGYDEENRLTAVCRLDSEGEDCDTEVAELEIEYDVLGRAVRRTVIIGQDERTFRYVYDGLSYAVIQEWEDGIGSGGAPGLLREFVYAGSHIEPVTMIDYTDGGLANAGEPELFHYLRDERNCVIALLDETGFLAESYRYDPYGRTYVWFGEADGPPDRVWSADTWLTAYPPPPNPLSPSFVGNPFGFTGHRFSAAGLFETPFRAYSPDLGRWLQRDPLGYVDGTNLHEYARTNPLSWLDPYGDTVIWVHRKLGGDSDRSKNNPFAHGFIALVTGRKVYGTISWGNTYDANGNAEWHRDHPADMKAAQEAVDARKAGLVGDDTLDPYVIEAYKVREKDPNHPSRHPWRLFNNCKHEGLRLLCEAKEKKEEAEKEKEKGREKDKDEEEKHPDGSDPGCDK